MNTSESTATTTEFEITIPTTDEKPAFERLPWKVLSPEAFEASQAHIMANFGRPPMAMAILADRSRVLDHSLTESEYREVVQLDELPEGHEMCSWPGCKHKVSPFRTALVLNGEIAKDRSGATVWRGNFLVIKTAAEGLVVKGFCNDHLAKARQSAEDACGERLHPMPFSLAVVRRQGIIDAGTRRRQDEQQAQEAFEASLAGRSTAVRGRFGSAPRNTPGNIGRRR